MTRSRSLIPEVSIRNGGFYGRFRQETSAPQIIHKALWCNCLVGRRRLPFRQRTDWISPDRMRQAAEEKRIICVRWNWRPARTGYQLIRISEGMIPAGLLPESPLFQRAHGACLHAKTAVIHRFSLSASGSNSCSHISSHKIKEQHTHQVCTTAPGHIPCW